MKRLAWLLLLVACKSTAATDSEAPEDIRFVAVVELDDSGGVVASGPLTAWSPSDPLFVAARRDNVRLVGYDEASLAAVGILEAAREGPLALSAARGCDPRLPDASWIAAWSPDGVTPLPEASTPALTAPRLDTICPELSQDLSVDVACVEPRCEPSVVASGPCSRTVELDCSSETRVTMRVDPAGRVCAEIQSPFGACEPNLSAVGYGLHTCGSCRIDTYAPPADASTGLDVQVSKIVEGPLRQPRDIERNRQPFRQNFYEGYVLDVVVLEDRLVVLAPADGYGQRCNFAPFDAEPMRLLFLDPETLTVTSSRATERCLTAIEPDRGSDGFVGVFGTFTDWYLGRFAPDGTLVERESFASSTFGDDYFDGGIHELHFVDDDNTIVVMANVYTDDGTVAGAVRTFAADSLRAVDRFPFATRRIEFATPGPGTTLYGFESRQLERNWYTIDTATGTLEDLRSLPLDQLFRSGMFAVHRQGGLLYSGGRGHDAVFALDPATEEVWSASAHVFDLRIFAMGAWPADPDLLIVGGGTATFYAAGVMLVDPADRRFRYDHAVDFSESAVTHLIDDGDGGVLAVLPWTGEIARIRPATAQ